MTQYSLDLPDSLERFAEVRLLVCEIEAPCPSCRRQIEIGEQIASRNGGPGMHVSCAVRRGARQ